MLITDTSKSGNTACCLAPSTTVIKLEDDTTYIHCDKHATYRKIWIGKEKLEKAVITYV
jgi:hypothetical protein